MSKFRELLLPAVVMAAMVTSMGFLATDRLEGDEFPERAPSLVSQAAAQDSTSSERTSKTAGRHGLGRIALPEEIAAWDIDISPDGRGLPEGSGDVLTGEEVFGDVCASCHGDFAEGVDNWPALAGGFDTLADQDPVKTVGSYWPYLSTVWDYVHRSMPFGSAQTLSDDEVYAIVAYILYSNDLVEEDFELSHETFNDVAMYNRDGFIVDDRAETEYSKWRTTPCMDNCKGSVEITMRASVLDVTPVDDGETQDAAMMGEDNDNETEVASAPPTDTQEETRSAGPVAASLDPALVVKGEKVFRKCKACHQIGEGAKNKSGPQLNGVMGRTFGTVEGFKYSKSFRAASEEGRVWNDVEMTAFLAKPRAYIKGTKMSFAGLKKQADVEALITYLRSAGE